MNDELPPYSQHLTEEQWIDTNEKAQETVNTYLQGFAIDGPEDDIPVPEHLRIQLLARLDILGHFIFRMYRGLHEGRVVMMTPEERDAMIESAKEDKH